MPVMTLTQLQARAELERRRRSANTDLVQPTNDEELAEAILKYAGIVIPNKKVCPNHVAPFTAFADAYFARHSIAVWKASRGFGGKSVMLATLGYMQAIMFGVGVNLLGGSGQQSANVHRYMNGNEPSLPNTFWKCPAAPRYLLKGDPTQRETKLENNGRISVLMASQTSVRGGHPAKLLLDEADEMELAIFDAAMGQTMPVNDVPASTVISSTHQYPDGTMTEILKRAREKNWAVYEFCWRENQGFWLSADTVAQKRNEVTEAMWKTEYDLQEPSGAGRAIMLGMCDIMFDKSLGSYRGDINEYIEIEPPMPGATYATGADWAKEKDWCIFVTWRTDVTPFRLVAFMRTARKPWPEMVSDFDTQNARYGNNAAHDATGIGNVVQDYTETGPVPVELKGATRRTVLNNYISAIEAKTLIAPYIEYMYNEHRYCTLNDLYGTGHLPDTFCAGALAYYAAGGGSWGLGMGS